MFASLLKAAESLTLLGLLFMNWQTERKERLALQEKHEKHLQSDIDRLLEQTEQK